MSLLGVVVFYFVISHQRRGCVCTVNYHFLLFASRRTEAQVLWRERGNKMLITTDLASRLYTSSGNML